MSNYQFTDKIVLITGAGSGIGAGTARAFAKAGASLILSDINETNGKAITKELKETGTKAVFRKTDVSNYSEILELFSWIKEQFGQLDIAINNAGIGGPWAKMADLDVNDYHTVIAVNQTSVFYCMQEELKMMLAQGSGSIVNLSSASGLQGFSNASAYCASKHAVIGLTKSAAVEYARKNIRVNAVCPAFTKSPLVDQLLSVHEDMEEALRRNIPMRRYGEPEDVANSILWLCAEQSSFITGLALPVDGGYVAGK